MPQWMHDLESYLKSYNSISWTMSTMQTVVSKTASFRMHTINEMFRNNKNKLSPANPIKIGVCNHQGSLSKCIATLKGYFCTLL